MKSTHNNPQGDGLEQMLVNNEAKSTTIYIRIQTNLQMPMALGRILEDTKMH